MNTTPEQTTRQLLIKVPQVTIIFWIIKIAATTLGETGGDAVSMSMNLGYLVGTGIFAAIFAVAVTAQVRADRFHPFLYWSTIIATTTVGTTLADFADRSLGIGYAGGASLLFALLMGSLLVWYRSMGSVSVDTVRTRKAEVFYWVTIMFSQTLGTAWETGPRIRPASATQGERSFSPSCWQGLSRHTTGPAYPARLFSGPPSS